MSSFGSETIFAAKNKRRTIRRAIKISVIKGC
jgi:hypothetical protein